MEIIKVYVVGNSYNYASWINNYELVENIEDANVVLFTGGEDVYPGLYNKHTHKETLYNLERDKKEQEIFNKIKKDQLALGICRGSQFLCVMNDGILVQNCYGHCLFGTHPITNGDKLIEITSTHHQMQYPFNINSDFYDIIYYSASNLSCEYEGDGIRKPPCEPEIVIYHNPEKPMCLAIQGHPEIMRKSSPVINILNELLIKCLKEI